jgi:glycerol-3-phosphate dehydrogenase
VVFSFSGIRPLPRSDHDFTGRISRGHSVERIEGSPPQLCMVGGKWTTFRAFAEEAADVALKELRHTRRRSSLSLPIGGGTDFPSDPAAYTYRIAAEYSVSPERAGHLVDAYGSRAESVAEFCRSYLGDAPLDQRTCETTGEIAYLVRREFAVSLGDLVLRRTSLAITGRVSIDSVTRIAEIAAAELGWDRARREQEINEFVGELNAYYGVTPAMLAARSGPRRS